MDLNLDSWADWLQTEYHLRPRTIHEYVLIARKSMAAGDPLAEAQRTDVSESYRMIALAAALRLVQWARPAAVAALRKRMHSLAPHRRVRAMPPPPIADAEWQRLKLAVNALRDPWRKLFQLIMASGMRIGDALGIRRSAIAVAARDPAGAINVEVKGGRTIQLPYAPLRSILERLALRKPEWDEAWQLIGSSKPRAEESMRRVLRRAAHRAGITRRVYPHLLRHTVAYRLIERTKDIHLVSKLLGHSSIETTQLYVWYRSLKSMGQALEGQSSGGPAG